MILSTFILMVSCGGLKNLWMGKMFFINLFNMNNQERKVNLSS